MSVEEMKWAESAYMAAENMRLRQDIGSQRQALSLMAETNDALRRENQRLRDVIKLIGMETERHRLAVDAASREV